MDIRRLINEKNFTKEERTLLSMAASILNDPEDLIMEAIMIIAGDIVEDEDREFDLELIRDRYEFKSIKDEVMSRITEETNKIVPEMMRDYRAEHKDAEEEQKHLEREYWESVL